MTACANCKIEFRCSPSRINRAASIGAPLYCGRVCAGLARRNPSPPTDAERRAAKSRYDAARRAEKWQEIKAKKAAYFARTYDPAKAAIERKKRMPAHVEYCRRPEYKAWKSSYDRAYRANKHFGDFAEAFLLLQEIEREVETRATRYEIYQVNSTINKAKERRRTYERLVGNSSEDCTLGNAQQHQGQRDAAGPR